MNVLNAEAIATQIRKLVRKEHRDSPIGAWFTSTFTRHVLNDAERMIPCVHRKEAQSPLARMFNHLVTTLAKTMPELATDKRLKYHVVDDTTLTSASWIPAALDRGDLVYCTPLSESEVARALHWQDFMEELPARQIRHTVAAMESAVHAWDMAARRKEYGVTHGGVDIVDFQFSNPAVILVSLQSKSAFETESQLMDHCVGRSDRYFKRRATNPIYSLRALSSDSEINKVRTDNPQTVDAQGNSILPPLATFEVDLVGKRVFQVRGYRDVIPCLEIVHLVNEWAIANQIRFFAVQDEEDEDEFGDEVNPHSGGWEEVDGAIYYDDTL